MKIAVVIPEFGLIGGAEGFAYEVTERLARQPDFEIHLLAHRLQGKAPAGITFHKIPPIPFPRFFRPVGFALFTKALLKRIMPAVVHSHERIFESDVFTLHGIPHRTWIREARRKKLSFFDRSTAWVERKGFCSVRAPILLAVSSLVKEETLGSYHLPESRVRIIHPGLNLERFDRSHRDEWRSEVRRLHGLGQRDVVVLFVGMNFEIKRLDWVLRSVAYLTEKGVSALKLLVVGRGDVDKYRVMSRDLGIGENVIFAGVSAKVEKYYFASDIFVMPSRFDTFGLVVLEAMGAGLPVVISRRVGAKDMVSEGVNGFVIDENGTVPDLGDRIALLLHEETRLTMGQKAREVALQFTWEKTTHEIAEVYLERAEKNLCRLSAATK
jgi:UDP-glucose:(heptosyl)LPS alpha-1,3-glucosyltransferase